MTVRRVSSKHSELTEEGLNQKGRRVVREGFLE